MITPPQTTASEQVMEHAAEFVHRLGICILIELELTGAYQTNDHAVQ